MIQTMTVIPIDENVVLEQFLTMTAMGLVTQPRESRDVCSLKIMS